MTARHDATPRQSHPSARRSTVSQASQPAQQSSSAPMTRQEQSTRQAQTGRAPRKGQATQRARASRGTQATQQARPSRQVQGGQQAARRRSAQGQVADSRRRQAARTGDDKARRKATRRRRSVDVKVVAIVVVSLVVVLGVVGFFASRRGLLDWTGIGMRKVTLSVRAEGFDEESTPIPLHVSGSRASGVAYERDVYVTAGQESISLPKGSYTASVTASPIASGGTIYTVPATPVAITIEGRDAQVAGNSTGTLALELEHLDIIDATDAQVSDAIAAAQASAEKRSSEVVDRNVPALQRLRQQSVLPDNMPEALVLESTMSGWTTTVSILPDGSFSGTYTQLVSSQASSDYPNGTAYTCNFTGKFSDVERIGETGFSMKLGDVELEYEVGEKWVEDGVLNVGAQPLGFETGGTFELWRPGTSTEDLGWWLSAWCVDYAETGVPEQLDRWALDNVDASYGFFSEGPKKATNPMSTSEGTGDTTSSDSASDTTTDSASEND